MGGSSFFFQGFSFPFSRASRAFLSRRGGFMVSLAAALPIDEQADRIPKTSRQTEKPP